MAYWWRVLPNTPIGALRLPKRKAILISSYCIRLLHLIIVTVIWKHKWVLFLFRFFGFQVASATLLCNYHAEMLVDFFEKFCILLSPSTLLSNFNFYTLTQSIMPRSSLMFPWQKFIMKTWHFSDLLAQLKLKGKINILKWDISIFSNLTVQTMRYLPGNLMLCK